MSERIRRVTPYLPAVVSGLAALLLVWQVLHLGMVTCQTFRVSWRVSRWERSAEAKKEKTPGVEQGKSDKPGAEPTDGSPAPQGSSASPRGNPSPAKVSPPASPDPRSASSGLPGQATTAPKSGPGTEAPGKEKKEKDKYDEILTKGLFSKQQDKPTPLACTGIIGNSAIINGQLVKVGGQVGEWKVIGISVNKVVVEKEGQKQDLVIFPMLNTKQSPQGGGSPPAPGAPVSEPGAAAPEPGAPGSGPGGPQPGLDGVPPGVVLPPAGVVLPGMGMSPPG